MNHQIKKIYIIPPQLLVLSQYLLNMADTIH